MNDWGPADWAVVIFFGFLGLILVYGVIALFVGAIVDWWEYQGKIGRRFENIDTDVRLPCPAEPQDAPNAVPGTDTAKSS